MQVCYCVNHLELLEEVFQHLSSDLQYINNVINFCLVIIFYIMKLLETLIEASIRLGSSCSVALLISVLHLSVIYYHGFMLIYIL